MSKFDPSQYVALIKQGGFESAMVYATCHNGNSYYPTRVGHMDRNLKGRDIFDETVALLRENALVPQAYHTVIFQRRYALAHPDWRITLADGSQSHRRSWYNCPNNPAYLEFAKSQVEEIIEYDIDSIFIDMTFWPGVCVCHTCRQKFRQQHGGEIPQVIDWADTNWVAFHRARLQWLSDFAHALTNLVKSKKPGLLVTHQGSPMLLGWYYGQSSALLQACDYTSGDFYGDRSQHRIGAKALAAFSKSIPYEFMTSRCVNLYDHTSTKSEGELLASAATTLANGGAYFFIDAINPDGTLNAPTYERLGRVASTLQPFKEKVAQLKPVIHAEVALYYSMASHVNHTHNGLSLSHLVDPANNMDPTADIPCLKELVGTSAILNRTHIPYKIITDQTNDLTDLKTIILNDTQYLSPTETERLREFVRNGGTLIATGMSSFYDLDGNTSGDLALADVFGVSYTRKRTMRVHYIATDDGEYVFCNDSAPIVEAVSANVAAHLAEPMFDPDDVDRFASYHSTPPGPIGPHPALAINTFGQGTAIYLASSVLATRHDAQQVFGQTLFQQHIPSLVTETNAPPCVEITLLRATTSDALLLCFVNAQKETPSIPIHNLTVTVTIPPDIAVSVCRRVSNGSPMSHVFHEGVFSVELDKLETIEMIEIQ